MIEELCDYILKSEDKVFRERIDLTVIIAAKESDDALLIGADKMNLESDQLKVGSSTKLFKHLKENIVWGCAGNREIARNEFSPWLQSLDIGNDWQAFKKRVADKIAELNGEQRARMEKAGVKSDDNSVITCLLVGWIKEEPQIIEFTNDGKIDSYIEDGFQAIGCKVIPWSAYIAMSQIKGINNEVKFKIILKTTVSLARDCGNGYDIMRVMKDGVEDVK